MNLKDTEQMEFWKGDFGTAYTDRNSQSFESENETYKKEYGQTRTKMNKDFLSGIDHSSKFLEVGANIGLQLEILRQAGFSNLFGIEINEYAVARAKHLHPKVDVIKGTAFELPFKDQWFDIAYTSGVLIHIAPKDIAGALKEIHRVSRRYIWGFEYYAPELTEINYRGNKGFLWKRDFAALYRELFPDLRLVKERRFPSRGTENIDSMFLLEKKET